jgi:branched-chain amino acid transport system substrate-binding protein
MGREGNKVTRRTFLKAGLVAGGMGALGVPTLLRAEPREVKVGLLAPLTGVSANWGPRAYNSCLLCAQLINEAGGIKSMGGAKMKVVVGDTETKPEIAGIQAEKLIADKDILILSGSNQSAATMIATQVAERNHICFITGTDGAPQITERGFQYTYRTTPTMVDYARDLIYFARDMGKQTGKVVKKLAILCENSIFGVSAGDNASKFGKEVGFDVVDYSTYDPATTRDFTGYISKYKSAGVDFLACHNRPQDGILITRTMKELDFNPLGYGGMLGAHSVYDFPEALGKDSNFVLTTSNFVEAANIPGLKEISARFKKLYNTSPDTNFIAGFSVLPLLKSVLEANPSYDREKVKQAIDKANLKVGENNNMQINGIKWTPNHDNALAQAFVLQYEGAVMYPVAPAAFATKKPVWPRPTWDQIKKM